MLSAYLNCFKIPELKKRLLFTLGIIFLCRLTSIIPCPGVDPSALSELFKSMSANKGTGGVLDMLDLFSGGALENFAVGALGIMPYISASIILQLMTPVIPALNKMVREGESGHQKYNQITRYITILICVIQGTMFSLAMISPEKLNLGSGVSVILNPGPGFVVSTVIILTAGSMFICWLGEMITEYGVGNGASLIITINIVARLPGALMSLFTLVVGGAVTGGSEIHSVHLLILLAMFFLVTAGAIALTQGMRKIPVRYAQRVAGVGKTSAMQTSYLPLKVNYSGVMPIIFAGAILSFPMMLLRFAPDWAFFRWLIPNIQHGSNGYLLLYGLLILIFSFFWVANQFNPIQIADDLQKRGGYIPGIRPGAPTSDFLDHAMTRITLAGAIALTVLAILPMILSNAMGIPSIIAQFFGGTSLLIIVGVSLDTMRQVETFLINRRYDGFMSKGQIRARR
ncbi:MAG: preprotein translocase subunit SecY [Lentisphaeria bacterium]|nr:preprotein translocase subunit SecY [Lentisphaeria bacterium]MDY0176626.1 preprotein translocase subunit SecY [Lentisphaeria bacterium]NLZ59542.1 preprotein translocase subunit SecY [Lentisphaerota bacterium]